MESVSLTVGELLASALAVKKQLTKTISEDKAIEFQVNILNSNEALEVISSSSWYSIRSLKAKVCLKDGSKVTALLDTGAEINVMTKELMEDANLAMRRGPKLELVSHTGHSRPIISHCEDVGVAVEGLKTRHPIFIVEAGDHNLVLGQLFLNSIKFSQEYKPNEIFGTITHFFTHQSAVFRTLTSQDPVNQRENQIFPHSLNLNGRCTRSLQFASVFSLKIQHGIRQFCPKAVSASLHFWFSQQCNLHTLSQHFHIFPRARVDGTYKRTSQKVQPVDLSLSEGSKPDGSDTWKIYVIQEEISIFDPANEYTHLLIPQFTHIAKRARLTQGRLGKMIIRDSMTDEEKKSLLECYTTKKLS